MDFFDKCISVIPRLRTKIQLSGLVLTIAAFIITKLAAPSSKSAPFVAGGIGICIIVFAQVFERLHQIPERQRANLIVTLFVVFCVFVAVLLVITIRLATGSTPDDSIATVIADDRTVRTNMLYIAQLDGYTVDFAPNCKESYLSARVEGTTLKAKSTLELIELVGYHLKKPELRESYTVSKFPERGIYAVTCKD